uniref:Uncharacterized protein n=1 Tax=Vespula pensylvanica TaxID=30213 RepID=A0A834NQQ5_VESPE|nr:hypothetical protein H0235_012325 [Vespula pensylvanica]
MASQTQQYESLKQKREEERKSRGMGEKDGRMTMVEGTGRTAPTASSSLSSSNGGVESKEEEEEEEEREEEEEEEEEEEKKKRSGSWL